MRISDWSSDVCSSDLLAARDPGKIKDLAADLDAKTYACDVADRASVDAMVAQVTADLGLPDVVLFNASARLRGPFTELDSGAGRQALLVTCYRSEEHTSELQSTMRNT